MLEAASKNAARSQAGRPAEQPTSKRARLRTAAKSQCCVASCHPVQCRLVRRNAATWLILWCCPLLCEALPSCSMAPTGGEAPMPGLNAEPARPPRALTPRKILQPEPIRQERAWQRMAQGGDDAPPRVASQHSLPEHTQTQSLALDSS